MNRLSFSLVTLVLLLTGISEIVAQTASSARVLPASAEPVRIEFKGLNALQESTVRERLEKRGIVFRQTQLPDADVVSKAAEILKSLLQSEGYTQATVDVLTNKEARSVRFNIDEGPRLPIVAVRFSGNRVFSGDSLSASIHECVANIGGKAVEFDYCLRRVTDLMRDLGYLRASVGEPTNRITSTGRVLTIPVTEGPLYRVGEISIAGAQTIPAEQIRAKLALAQGDIVGASAVGKWLYVDVKKLYGDLGYIEYTAEVQPEFRKVAEGVTEGVADFKVTIDEGRLFRLGSIEFKGNDLPAKEMRKLFLMKDGDAFSQQQFEAGIKRLNQSGLLEVVDQDADCDYTTDADEGLVTVVIKATPRNSGSSGHATASEVLAKTPPR